MPPPVNGHRLCTHVATVMNALCAALVPSEVQVESQPVS